MEIVIRVTISCSVPFECVLPRSTENKTMVGDLEFIIIVEVDDGNNNLMGNRVSWVDDCFRVTLVAVLA